MIILVIDPLGARACLNRRPERKDVPCADENTSSRRGG
jgi:hypothetical protein